MQAVYPVVVGLAKAIADHSPELAEDLVAVGLIEAVTSHDRTDPDVIDEVAEVVAGASEGR